MEDANLVITDRNGFIKVTNEETGVVNFFNKNNLFIEKDGESGVLLRNDSFISSYAYTAIKSPVTDGLDELIEILSSWLDPMDTSDGISSQHLTVLDLRSAFGLSVLRDRVDTSGDASVSNTLGAPEYVLRVGPNQGDSASLRSVERGRYLAGSNSEVNIAVRLETSGISPGQEVRFGYFDDDNGFFFQYDSVGLAVVIRKDGQDTLVYSPDWNVDRLDGTGPSNFALDLARGTVYQVVYRWFGYGTAVFKVLVTRNRTQFLQTVHQFARPAGPALSNPNLPISASIVNKEGGATERRMFVIERQLNLVGPGARVTSANPRITTINRVDASVDRGLGFVSVMNVRRKAGYVGKSVRIVGLDFDVDEDCIFQVRVNADVGEAITFESIEDIDPSETSLEADVSSGLETTVQRGVVIFAGLALAKGTMTPPSFSAQAPRLLEYVLEEDQVFSLCLRSYKANVARATFAARFSEDW